MRAAAAPIQDQRDRDAILRATARLVPMLSGTACCALLTPSADGDLELHSEYGLDAELRAAARSLALAAGSAAGGLPESPALPVQPSTEAAMAPDEVMSGAVFPIFAGDEFCAVLVTDSPPAERSPAAPPGPDRRELSLFLTESIVRQTSAALLAQTLRQAHSEEQYVSFALLQVARAVAGVGDLDGVLASVARLLPALVGVDRCLIYHWREDTRSFELVQGHGVSVADATTGRMGALASASAPLLWELRRIHKVGSEAEIGDSTPLPGPVDEREAGVLSELLSSADGTDERIRALPLIAQGRFVGVLVLAEGASQDHGNPRREELLKGIADQTAVAIRNDQLEADRARQRRLEQEMALANQIQRRLMAEEMPQLAGWDLASLCVPAREVGGDFFDVFDLGGNHLGMVVADVSDKGLPAALFMANSRALIRALASYHESPAAVLEEVNRLLLPDSYKSMFVTVLYAVLDLRSGLLTYCNAGHNLPLVWRSGGASASFLEGGGTALAVVDDPRIGDRAVRLSAGDGIVLYTDGIPDALSAETEQPFGEERLLVTTQRHATGPAKTLLGSIQKAVEDHASGAPQFDDQTMLVVARTMLG